MADLCVHEVHRCTVCHDVDRDGPPADSRPFIARFDGTCRWCGFDINRGDRAIYVADQVMHQNCAKEVDRG